jgi:hypothetical protein
VQGSPRRGIINERQSGMPAIAHAHHASLAAVHAGPTLAAQHSRQTRVLARQNEADTDVPTQRCEASVESVTCIETNLPGSPSHSIDRLSACSNSSKGPRKVMALHAPHGSLRESGPSHAPTGHQLHHHNKYCASPGHLLQSQRVWDHTVRVCSMTQMMLG